jgi:hypothetical protein
MYKLKFAAVFLFASTFAGAQAVTVGTLSSVQNGTTTTITVPVSVAVPPVTSAAASPALASLVVNSAIGNNDGKGILAAGAAFTTIPLTKVVSDSASGWNWTTNSYAVPVTGTYLIVSHVRLLDGAPAGIGYGQGVNSTNSDDANFFWSTTVGLRNSITNTSIVQLTAGTAVKLFMYVDSASPIGVYSASLSIQQLP